MKIVNIADKTKIYKAPSYDTKVSGKEFSHYSLDIEGTKGKYKVGDILPLHPTNTSLNLFPQFKDIKETKMEPVEFTFNAFSSLKLGSTKTITLKDVTEDAIITLETTTNINAIVEGNKIKITAIEEGDFSIDIIASKEGMITTTKQIKGIIT